MEEEKIKGTIMIVPDVEGIYWGRGVGYNLEMVKIDKEIKKISATKIRKGIANEKKLWKKMIAKKDISYLLTDRTSRIAQSGLVIWLTGCPCSGKTVISQNLRDKIKYCYSHLKIQILDGDVIRNTPIAQGIGFSPEDRALHIKRMAQVAKMLADQGVLTICAFVSPQSRVRNQAKRTIGKGRFVEVYVKASQKTRIKRDKKGLYKKAQAGKIPNLTGYNAPYDKPCNPDIICDTEKETIRESVNKLFNHIFF